MFLARRPKCFIEAIREEPLAAAEPQFCVRRTRIHLWFVSAMTVQVLRCLLPFALRLSAECVRPSRPAKIANVAVSTCLHVVGPFICGIRHPCCLTRFSARPDLR